MSREDHQNKIGEFTIYPSNIDVEIKEIRPFFAYNYIPLILNLEISIPYDLDITTEIESEPIHGTISQFGPLVLIYKADKAFCGMDKFKIRLTDKLGESHTETILIYVNN